MHACVLLLEVHTCRFMHVNPHREENFLQSNFKPLRSFHDPGLVFTLSYKFVQGIFVFHC